MSRFSSYFKSLDDERVTISLDITCGSSALRNKFRLVSKSTLKWFRNREIPIDGFIPIEFCSDREYVLKAVSKFPLSLQHAHQSLRNDKEIVLTAFLKKYKAFEYATFDLRMDREFVNLLVQLNGKALRYATSVLCDDTEIALASLTKDVRSYPYLSYRLKTDREVLAILQNQIGLSDRKTRVRVSFNLPHVVLQDMDYMIPMASSCPEVISDSFALRTKVRNEFNLLLKLASENASIVEEMQFATLSSRFLMMSLVQMNGLTLKYAIYSLKKDKQLVLQAVKQNWRAIQFAGENLRTDRDILLCAASQGPDFLDFVKPLLNSISEPVKLEIMKLCGCLGGCLTERFISRGLEARYAHEYPEMIFPKE